MHIQKLFKLAACLFNDLMPLYFVKLGGSVITDTAKPDTAKVNEIKAGIGENKMLLGHGSGSFGHVAVHKYGLEKGLSGQESAYGAALAHKTVHELNNIVIDVLTQNGINAIKFPPSAGGLTKNGRITSWNPANIISALNYGFVPVVFGDLFIDSVKGVHAASTEQVFEYLATKIRPNVVIAAGDIDGVFDSDPKINKDAKLIEHIDSSNIRQALKGTGGSLKIDVTGGMRTKLMLLYKIAKKYGAKCMIINATVPGRLQKALIGEEVVGTVIEA